MQRQLDEIVAGERMRRDITDRDTVVEIVQTNERGDARLRSFGAREGLEDFRAARTVDANDGERAASDRRRRSDDRVERSGAHDSRLSAGSSGRRITATRL